MRSSPSITLLHAGVCAGRHSPAGHTVLDGSERSRPASTARAALIPLISHPCRGRNFPESNAGDPRYVQGCFTRSGVKIGRAVLLCCASSRPEFIYREFSQAGLQQAAFSISLPRPSSGHSDFCPVFQAD